MLEGGDARFFHERVGVFTGRHEHEAPFVLFIVLAENGFQRLARGFLPGGVAIEGEIDFLRAFFQLADMGVANGGAEGGDGIFHAVLPQFDDVHIAFGNEQGALTCLHRLMQAVQLEALVKPRRLRRVQVFRLRFTHCPRTKGDDFAFDAVDGEDDALAEPVVVMVVFDADQPHILQQLQRVFAAEVSEECVAGRGIAELESIDCRFFQLPLAQVIARRLAALAVKRFMKKRCCVGKAFQTEVVAVFFLRINLPPVVFVGDIQPVKFGEPLDGFREGQVVIIHQEADGIAADAAAKAVVKAFLRIDAERRRFFLMKRAASPMVAARFLGEGNTRRQQREQIGSRC